MTKLVTVETIFYIRLELTQFYLLGQPAMLGFWQGCLVCLKDYGLTITSLFQKLVQCFHAALPLLSATRLLYPLIGKPMLLQQCLETQVFLAKYW